MTPLFIEHRQTPTLDLAPSTHDNGSFPSPPTMPPSTTTTLTTTLVHHHPRSPPPSVTTTIVYPLLSAHAHNHHNKNDVAATHHQQKERWPHQRQGGFPGATSPRAMWQPNDEQRRCRRSSLFRLWITVSTLPPLVPSEFATMSKRHMTQHHRPHKSQPSARTTRPQTIRQRTTTCHPWTTYTTYEPHCPQNTAQDLRTTTQHPRTPSTHNDNRHPRTTAHPPTTRWPGAHKWRPSAHSKPRPGTAATTSPMWKCQMFHSRHSLIFSFLFALFLFIWFWFLLFLLDYRKVLERFLSTYTCMRRCQANITFRLQLSGHFFQQKLIISKLLWSTILPFPFYLKDRRFKALCTFVCMISFIFILFCCFT